MKRNVYIPDPLARACGLEHPDCNVSERVQEALKLWLGAGEQLPAATRLRAAIAVEERAEFPRPQLVAQMRRYLANRHADKAPV